MTYSTIVHKDGSITGKPITVVEKKDKDGNITIEDGVSIGHTIYFELTGNIVEKTGQGFKVKNFIPKKGVAFEDGKYQDVSLFQPVLHSDNEKMPGYSKSWETYSGKGKTAKRLYTDFPDFYVEYAKEQRRRCIEGYEVDGVKITGIHYWYLNFWPIRSKKIGVGYTHPRFLDLDKDFFDNLEICLINGKHFLVLKRRQMGFSEKIAAVLAYYARFYPACQVGVIAGEERFSKDTFNKCKNGIKSLSRFSRNFADFFATRFIKDTELEFKTGYTEDGVDKGYLSEGFCITTKTNLAAMAGKSFAVASLEEFGMMPHSDVVMQYLIPTMEEGGVLGEGKIIIAGGTGGEMDKGAAYFQKHFYNPSANNFYAFKNEDGTTTGKFYGAQWYYVTDDSGNSYHYESEYIVRAIRSGITSSVSLLTFITQMPLNPAEAFLTKDDTPFYTEKLSAKRDILQANPLLYKLKYTRFDWIKSTSGEIIGVEQKEGKQHELDIDGDALYPFVQIEDFIFKDGTKSQIYLKDTIFAPIFADRRNALQIKGLYQAGTDSYDQDYSSTSSLGGFAIYKGFLNEASDNHIFVGRMLWRPTKKEKFYEQTLMACLFCGAYNLIEHSKLMIFNYYYKLGFDDVLANKPTILYQDKDTKTSNKKGVDASTKSYWETYFRPYVEDYGHNNNDPLIVDRIIKYKTHINNDLAIAMMLARLQYEEEKFIPSKPSTSLRTESKKVAYMGYVKSKTGQMQIRREVF